MDTVVQLQKYSPTLSSVKLNLNTYAGGLSRGKDESVMSWSESPEIYNVDMDGGVYSSEVLPARLSVRYTANGITMERTVDYGGTALTYRKIFCFYIESLGYNVLLVQADNGTVRLCGLGGNVNPMTGLSGVAVTGDMQALLFVQGDSEAIIFGDTSNAYIYKLDGSVTRISGAPRLTSMCVHYERIFAADMTRQTRRIRFSAPADAADWSASLDTGGYIDLLDDRGSIIKLISFRDSVYIFRRRGISRLTGYGDQSAFYIIHIAEDIGNIAPDSIVVCNDRIMYTADGGVFEFDGLRSRCVSSRIADIFGAKNDFTRSCAVFYDNKYIVYFRLNDVNILNESDKDMLLRYDTVTGCFTVARGVAASGFCVIRQDAQYILALVSPSVPYISAVNKSDPISGSAAAPAFWRTPYNDMGVPDALKRVECLYLTARTNGDLFVNVTADGKKYTAAVNTYNQPRQARIPFTACGRRLSVSFETRSDVTFTVSNPVLFMRFEPDGGEILPNEADYINY